MKNKKIFALSILGLSPVVLLGACNYGDTGGSATPPVNPPKDPQNIHILYTNDVHTHDDTDENSLNHASLLKYKMDLEAKGDKVYLVDIGDAIQGTSRGSVTRGEYGTETMNLVGYDYAIFGNHEFDYGMDRLEELVNENDATYLNGNLRYTGEGTSFVNDLAPYAILEERDVKIGLIALTTPETLTASTPAYFQENGEFVYDFYQGDNGNTFYNRAQDLIDEVRNAGAELVIALTHLGDDQTASIYNSRTLIEKTTGLNAVLDGHAHNIIHSDLLNDLEGNKVWLTSTGAYFENIGDLTITPSKEMRPTLISKYEAESETLAKLEALNTQTDSEFDIKVGTSEVAMAEYDSENRRIVRARETPLGNFVADAYRYVAEADVAIANGGGVRGQISVGVLTYNDLISVQPYGNTLAAAEVTGQVIADALEWGAQNVKADLSDVNGYDGSFLQVSGLKYTVDTSKTPSITATDDGMFVSIDGDRRVQDIEILQDDGSYAPIDLEATYRLACYNYILLNHGGGFTMFDNSDFYITEGALDYECLARYLEEDTSNGALGGVISTERYGDVEGRITIL